MDYNSDPASVKRDAAGHKLRQKVELCPHCGEEIAPRDRLHAYREYRRQFGHGAYVVDLDQVEIRSVCVGVMVQVGVLELTLYEPNPEKGWLYPTAGYLENIRRRYTNRDFQGQNVVRLAELLGCHAYVVLIHPDLTHFWAYDLSRGFGWIEYNHETYKAWLIAKQSP